MTSISLRQSELGNRLQSPAEARVAAGRLANGSVTYLLSRHARPIIWRSVGPLQIHDEMEPCCCLEEPQAGAGKFRLHSQSSEHALLHGHLLNTLRFRLERGLCASA